jgi:hypothetical protein
LCGEGLWGCKTESVLKFAQIELTIRKPERIGCALAEQRSFHDCETIRRTNLAKCEFYGESMNMKSNSETIIEDILNQKNMEIAPETNASDFFEIFSAEQATKEYELSYEEIESGIVDGEHDGGIDSIYTFVNGEVIGEEIEFQVPKKDVNIELIIVQSKTGSGFSENAINKLISTTGHLLNLNSNYTLLKQYNDQLKSRSEIFRESYRKVASKFPSVKIKYVYATKKSVDKIHPNLKIKSEELIQKTKGLFSESVVEFLFWDATSLLSLARMKPKQVFELKFD